MKPELTLLYVHGDSIGYARLGTELAAGLTKRGVEVYDHQEPPASATAQMNMAERLVAEGRRQKDTNTVCWVSVPGHARGWYRSQSACLFTMWEATRLPETFRETLHEFDMLIVPSMQNVELFGRYHNNVKYVPLGFNPDLWKFVPRQDPIGTFNFLIGGSGLRKGTDLAAKAFKRLWGKDGSWGDGPVPMLYMKSPRGDMSCGEGDRRVSFDHPRIKMVSGRLDTQEEIDLYATAHCYIQPSRGEGFGLQPLQAIAQGIPTILTDAHGHAAYSHLGYGLSSTMQKSDYFIYGDAGDWWEPSFDELCEYMQYVYDNWEHARDKAAMASRSAHKHFTWGVTAAKFQQALGDRLITPYEPSEWFEPDPKLYEIVTLQDWVADIGGIVYSFKRGVSYYEMADVKRILFEAGLLDPRCISDDGESGLHSSQVERAGAYRARHELCPMCGQTVNVDNREMELVR